MKSFFGYPGGKSRLAKRLISDYSASAYAEPFAGGFSVGLAVLERETIPVWINDLDKDIASLWKVAIRHTDEFCNRIMSAKITAAMFYKLRERILNNEPRSQMDRAIDKLIIHKLSYSNMGEKAASPVGGRKQTGDWKFDVRWNPKHICQAIRRVVKVFGKVRITSQSVFDILPTISKNTLVYLDPPYVGAGSKCYKRFFTETDHRDLARALQSVKFKWFMTYDNHPLIRELYHGQFQKITLNYQMSSAYRKDQQLKPNIELLIKGN